MVLISTSEINNIINEIEEVIQDDNISTSIIYRTSGTTVSTWDPTDGVIPALYSDPSAVSAFKTSYTLDEVDFSGGLIELGDTKFIVMLNSVTGILSTKDKIYEAASDQQSATTYEVRNIVRDPLSQIVYFIQARAI